MDGFLSEHCYACHAKQVHIADFRIDTLSRDLSDPAAAIAWQNLIDRVKKGAMPPSSRPRPSSGQLNDFVTAVDRALKREAEKSAPSDRIEIRRLSRSALDNTVADLLGTRLTISDDLPADTEVAGFDNMARTLGQSQQFLDILQRNARRLASDVISGGPDPRALRRYSGGEIARGARVAQQDDLMVLWSSKNRFNVVWPEGFAAPRTGVYRIHVSAYEKDNRLELEKAGKTYEPTPKSAPAAERPKPAIAGPAASSAGGDGGPRRVRSQ